MLVFVGLTSFLASLFLLIGLLNYRNRDSLTAAMRQSNEQICAWLCRTCERTGGLIQRHRHIKMEGFLMLLLPNSQEPANMLLGALVIGSSLFLILNFGIYFSGMASADVPLFVCFVCFVLYAIISAKYIKQRNMLRIDIMKFVARLQHSLEGGAAPFQVVQWAASGDSQLSRQLDIVKTAAEKGIPLSKAFQDHFYGCFGIREASEIAYILQNGERGIAIAGHLRALNQDFRLRRETELLLRASKTKPAVTAVLTITMLFACIVLIIGPVIMPILKAFQ